MAWNWVRAVAAGCGLALLGVTSGCSYDETGAQDPITGRFVYFSVLGGEDIRDACEAGAPDRMRFIYNAIYTEHVRIYDVKTGSIGGALSVAISEPGRIGGVRLRLPLWSTPANAGEAALGAEQVGQLSQALEASGFFEPPPTGARLDSRTFYWAVSACLDGEFRFNAYAHPSERYDRMRFVPVLAALDPTGRPLPEPREIPRENLDQRYLPARALDTAEGRYLTFVVTVAENGLLGAHGAPFD